MKKVGIISQARMTSSRLPGKVLLEAGGKSMLEHHIDRLKEAGVPLYLAITDRSEDDPLEAFAQKRQIPYFRGDEDDVLSRFYHLATREALDVIVRVTSDCPLIDVALVKDGIRRFLEEDDDRIYLSICQQRTFPVGMDFEIISMALLQEGFERADLKHEREHVMPYFYQGRCACRQVDLTQSVDRSGHRLTVDTREDYELIRILIEEHDGATKSHAELSALLVEQPALMQLNAVVKQKKIPELPAGDAPLDHPGSEAPLAIDRAEDSSRTPLDPRAGLIDAGRLAMGTAQFGMGYGLSNQRGQTSAADLAHIIRLASAAGIEELDTSPLYGTAETSIAPHLADFRVVSKLPACGAGDVTTHLQASLRDLGVPGIEGYLVHDFASFVGCPDLFDEMAAERQAGRVKRIGFSLYAPAELEELLGRKLAFDCLQVPFNVFDQRFRPYFKPLAEAGVHIYLRSVFLQGGVFLAPGSLPAFLNGLDAPLRLLAELSARYEASIGRICLQYCLSQPHVHKVLLGVECPEQLRQNFQWLETPLETSLFAELEHRMPVLADALINPSQWPPKET